MDDSVGLINSQKNSNHFLYFILINIKAKGEMAYKDNDRLYFIYYVIGNIFCSVR
jgi:hypothetical protein